MSNVSKATFGLSECGIMAIGELISEYKSSLTSTSVKHAVTLNDIPSGHRHFTVDLFGVEGSQGSLHRS